ncbi:MAG TPA: hypothetical protein VF887_08450 [Gemmatimonadaceae bacterium]
MKRTIILLSKLLRRPEVWAAAALVTVSACGKLDVQNPNEPDARRALSDPQGVQAIAGGTFRTWFNTHQGMDGAGPLTTMADSYTASWNNYYMRLYSSSVRASDGPNCIGCAPRTYWRNDPADAERTAVEHYWYGYYSALSSATDVLTAIRKNNVIITDAANTKMVETVGELMQGMTMGELALNYDSAFVVDENSDLANLKFSHRQVVRDTAVAKLEAAAALADANAFSTPASWTNGTSYDNTQIARLARTYAARILAYYARNGAENAATNWARVATLASGGISTGGAFDFQFTGDGGNLFWDDLKGWSEDLTTERVHTRVAHMLDPVTQADPWPNPNGNPQPNSPDKRLGDGSYGTAADVATWFTTPKTANAGTDFAWSSKNIFRPARGMYHQSNITHIRYDYASFSDPAGTGGGFGIDPVITATENDLLWAEGLIRSGGNLLTAATLINNTHVGRGGLPPATPADLVAGLLTKLQYEQDIELMGLGDAVFFNRRRIDGLEPLTPRQMPVPAKELQVLGKPLYTFGGTFPDM